MSAYDSPSVCVCQFVADDVEVVVVVIIVIVVVVTVCVSV